MFKPDEIKETYRVLFLEINCASFVVLSDAVYNHSDRCNRWLKKHMGDEGEFKIDDQVIGILADTSDSDGTYECICYENDKNEIIGLSMNFKPSDFGQSDFGQSDFGQSDFGQSDFGQSDFGQSDFVNEQI